MNLGESGPGALCFFVFWLCTLCVCLVSYCGGLPSVSLCPCCVASLLVATLWRCTLLDLVAFLALRWPQVRLVCPAVIASFGPVEPYSALFPCLTLVWPLLALFGPSCLSAPVAPCGPVGLAGPLALLSLIAGSGERERRGVR